MGGDEDIKIDDTYTASGGIKLKLLPVAPALLQKLEATVEMPSRPYYEAETAFGTIEKYYHDPTTLETEDELHAWKVYVVGKRVAEEELTQKANKAVLSKGVVIPEEVIEKQFPIWEEEQKWLGIDVPSHPLDRKYHFLTTEIIKSPNDIVNVLERIMRLIGMTEEDLQAAEDQFRDSMEA